MDGSSHVEDHGEEEGEEVKEEVEEVREGVEEEAREEEEEEEEVQKKGSGEEFLSEVMEAVRLTRQPTPAMVRREKLVRMLKREMERAIARPGSFVAQSLRYNQNLARAYLRFGLPTCPPKDELAVRENRLLRRNKMMLMQLRREEN